MSEGHFIYMVEKNYKNPLIVTNSISNNEPDGWVKSLSDPVASTFSQIKNKKKKEHGETEQHFMNGNIAFIGNQTAVSAGDSRRLNTIFNMTLNTTGYSNNSLTRISPKEYLEMLGRETSKTNIRNARREIRNTIKKYYSIYVEVLVKQSNGSKNRNTFHVFGMLSEPFAGQDGKLYDKDGQDIRFNYDSNFFRYFLESGKPRVMLVPKGLFDNLDPKKDGGAWFLGLYLANDKRNNLEKENRYNNVGRLLEAAGILNQKDNSLSNVFKGVVLPFLRDLDKLGDGKKYCNGNGINAIQYKLYAPDGREIKSAKDLQYLSLSDLKQYRLKVTWNNYPEEYFKKKSNTKGSKA